ncbi:serine protease [Patescibacteria group bacterium]|nr:serine protease [Patescibacteria group bacterium]
MRSLIISIFCVILAYGSSAEARCACPTYRNISKNAKNLVLVYTKNALGKHMGAGSGIIIKQGLVVTALHVVDRPFVKFIFVRIKDGDKTTIKRVEKFISVPKYDLAYLPIKYKFKSRARLRVTPLVSGEPVYTLGYPLVAKDELPLKARHKKGFGRFFKYHPSTDLMVETQISTVPIVFGNSGGPLFDSAGNLVGLVRSYVYFGTALFPGYVFTESIGMGDILNNLPKNFSEKTKKPRR